MSINEKLKPNSLSQIKNEYYDLHDECSSLRKEPINVMDKKFYKKNRYSDIFAMRMTMATTDGKSFNDVNYFNGNYILGSKGEVDFVACQGPLANTINDFWTVMALNKVKLVVGRF